MTGPKDAETKIDSVIPRCSEQVVFDVRVVTVVRSSLIGLGRSGSFSFTADGTPLHVGMQAGSFFFYTKDVYSSFPVSVLEHSCCQSESLL